MRTKRWVRRDYEEKASSAYVVVTTSADLSVVSRLETHETCAEASTLSDDIYQPSRESCLFVLSNSLGPICTAGEINHQKQETNRGSDRSIGVIEADSLWADTTDLEEEALSHVGIRQVKEGVSFE